ncbi:hypothetical protein [Stigmatella aurantiaca]|nr:hypothetical protein [Stigmatella aurantiaca]
MGAHEAELELSKARTTGAELGAWARAHGAELGRRTRATLR